LKWTTLVDGLARSLLPLRCLLCGAAGSEGRDLCAGCHADLVRNTPACPRCALPLSAPAALCGECLQREPPFTAAWVPLRYGHPLDLLETRFKFGGDLAAGRVLSNLLLQHALADAPTPPQALICVPLHIRRLRDRGYNQSWELLRPLARALGVPASASALQRTRDTRAQTGLDAVERRRNLRGAFQLDPGWPLPSHVALFDDVMTTGSTLRECARVLRRAGVARVDVWALARAPSPRQR
jgi:ComF family protein